ncbi:SMI1/KNR4 family protein [Algibacter lectus]|uniref:SMI1/KNR4 family protein n=1 Tax=Algibacter lectus TaxID=221126 RepID=UPI0026EE2B38|nr:SMI1/KNR4 family protein [Algibacter lectus]MDO7138911.1 SMI1/KNR4 family protein [Algibacter lectus]
MWYKKHTFFDKQDGLKEIPNCHYFSRQLTEEEIQLFPDIKKLYPEFLENKELSIPTELTLTTELQELLEYSNGGGIINGDREFGYFSLQDIRYYYFAYGFPKWTPNFLPIAFNGGGKFYAYDFRDLKEIKIVAVGSGDLDYENSVIIGTTLDEVLTKKTNIEDELDKLYPEIKLNEKELRKIEIKQELIRLKNDKVVGAVDLKTYLKKKNELEKKLKEMNI